MLQQLERRGELLTLSWGCSSSCRAHGWIWGCSAPSPLHRHWAGSGQSPPALPAPRQAPPAKQRGGAAAPTNASQSSLCLICAERALLGLWGAAFWSRTFWSGTFWSGTFWNATFWSEAFWNILECSIPEWNILEHSGVQYSGVEHSGVELSGSFWCAAFWSGTFWNILECSILDWLQEALCNQEGREEPPNLPFFPHFKKDTAVPEWAQGKAVKLRKGLESVP